ncbi:MAG: CRISPR-associated endonuclease Cas1 [Acidobacteria bacterium]|nr:CRISPR-associated endonuclease Cas1 [Acidobacteriota bacterium]
MLPFGVEQLAEAQERVVENAGCAGADGVTVEMFARRSAKVLPELLDRVARGAYRPFPLLEIQVEKKPGSDKIRRLLVPAVRDRVLQTAVARHLSHSFEEEFLECSFGYRPGRSVDRAIARIRKCHELGYRYVVDADVQSYFDNVEHKRLLALLGERPLGEAVHGLLRQWVKAQVWNGSKVTPLRAGVPQGSPISPLLANFYLEDFDRELEKSGRKLVRYADDFLVLAQTPDEAHQALLETETLLAAAHLKVNEEKTHIVDFDHGFRFLGALFLGEAIWVPWKFEKRAKGRIRFMARPMPAALRTPYELAPPKSSMELALERADLPRPEPVAAKGRSEGVAFLYLTEQGSILRKAGDRLLVEREDEVLLDLPYHKLEHVLLLGNVQVTTQAMGELLEKGVTMSLFSRQGTYRGALSPPRGKNIDLRIAQFERWRDHGAAVEIAKAIVAAKIANGVLTLERYRRQADPDDDFADRQKALAASAEGTAAAAEITALDGMEGAAAKEYFALLMRFNKSEFEWKGRQKHPPPDPLNALLSLGYSFLMNELAALLEGMGLDPFLGFLHQVDYGRPSLALDVMEPFRHPVVDRLTLTLVNRKMMEAQDFRAGPGGAGMYLEPKAFRRFLNEWERWMLAKPAKGTCFRECLRTEAEKLCAALRDGAGFAPWRWTEDAEPEGGCNTSSVTT